MFLLAANGVDDNQRYKNNLKDSHLIKTTAAPLTFGEYHNVFLTEKEYKQLKADFFGLDSLIEQLSAYIQSTGKRYADHAAAKEGIRGLSRVAATKWGPDGINVNVVCPLAWTAKLEQFQQAYPDAFKANVKMPPMGHYGNAELEIGRVCVQLASPDFKFMSGETLTLEGGMGQRP